MRLPGRPSADACLYLPNRYVTACISQAQCGQVDLWRSTKPYLGDAVPGAIRDAGLDFDLLDDDAVSVLEPGSRRTIVLARAHDVPSATVGWLEACIAAGSTVVLVDSSVEVAGAITTDVEGLADTLMSQVGPDLAVVPAAPALGVLHRRGGSTEVSLLDMPGPAG